MKIKELESGIKIPITNEESSVFAKISKSDNMLKSELSEREQLLANSLVRKDLVARRKNDEGKIIFCKKTKTDWNNNS